VRRTRAALDALRFDPAAGHRLTVLPLELADLRATREFARLALLALREGEEAEDRQQLEREGSGGGGGGGGAAGGGKGDGGRLDYLLLNAAMTYPVGDGGVRGRWSDAVVVNHFGEWAPWAWEG
jgi:hypothetical protein